MVSTSQWMETTPIGEDLSPGNNNDWTPKGFGGSNSIEKATGGTLSIGSNAL